MMQEQYLSDTIKAVDQSIVDAKRDGKERKKNLRLKAKLLQELEYKTGMNLCSSCYSFASTSRAIDVKMSDMHEIKKVVGEVEESSVDIAHDYKTTNELLVTVRPVDGLYDMFSFQFRRYHQATDKCRVETKMTEPYSYDRLVCPID